MKEEEEKANEIIEKFYSINNEADQNKGTNPYISRDYAVQCALICVDEIIENESRGFDIEDCNPTTQENIIFWQQVKQSINQINKLNQ